MEAVLRRADALRALFWRVTVRTDLGRLCARDRSARLAVLGVGQIATTLALTLFAPLWLLLLGPILLGVPHAVSDVRYLVLQRPGGLDTRRALALGVPLGLMTLARVVYVFGGPRSSLLEVALGMAAIAAAVMVSGAPAGRRVIALALVAGVGGVACIDPDLTAIALAHVHNFVGLGLWLFWTRRAERDRGPAWRPALVAALLVAGCVAIGAGVFDPLLFRAGGPLDGSPAGLDFAGVVDSLAPGLAPEWAVRVVLVFAFAQAMHYTIWLRLIPGTLAERPASTGFRRNLANLRADLGTWGTRAAILASLAVPLAALVDAYAARAVYLSLILFHGWLELAVIAFLVLGGARVAATVTAHDHASARVAG